MSVVTSRPILGGQLKAELGGADVTTRALVGGVEVWALGVDDTTLAAAINAHVPSATFGMTARQLKLRAEVATLRTWAADGAVLAAAPGTLTQVQLHEVIRRLGLFFDGFADLLDELGLTG